MPPICYTPPEHCTTATTAAEVYATSDVTSTLVVLSGEEIYARHSLPPEEKKPKEEQPAWWTLLGPYGCASRFELREFLRAINQKARRRPQSASLRRRIYNRGRRRTTLPPSALERARSMRALAA